MLATDFLKNPAGSNAGPLVSLFGAERFLKRLALAAVADLVLGADRDPDIQPERLVAKECDLARLMDNLRTVSMWAKKQLVVLEEADDFVSEHRAALERYLDKPAKKSVLVLDVKTWPATTRLAKKTAEIGLPIDCAPLKPAQIVPWLIDRAKKHHGKTLDRTAAGLLTELAGAELGLLDMDLGKLTAYVGEKSSIDSDAVAKLVGGWKAETTWKMLDAVRDGEAGLALGLLEKLLRSGEAPLKLLGGINFTWRPLAKAVELSRLGQPLPSALEAAGVKPFQTQAMVGYLRRLGRPTAEKIGTWLLAADLDLKGRSQLGDRVVLERLLLNLSGQATPA